MAGRVNVEMGRRTVTHDGPPSGHTKRATPPGHTNRALPPGSWLAQASRGHCAIVELRGSAGAAPTIGRKTGFAAVIAQFPGMRVVLPESGDFTREGGSRAMAGFIKTTGGLKDIRAVWAHNDNMPLGAIEVMKAAGLRPGKDVLTISADGVPGIYRAMLADDANATVEVRSAIGKDIFEVVRGYLKGKHDYPKWVLIPNDLHTRRTPRRCWSGWTVRDRSKCLIRPSGLISADRYSHSLPGRARPW